MAKFSPLQLFTPIQLFFCVILFFLPWVEVQCVFPKEVLKDAPKEQMDKMKQEVGWDPNTPFGFLEQSGFQIAIGDASPGSDMRRVMAKMEKELGAKGMKTTPTKNNNKFDYGTDASGKKKDRSTAPLLFVYPVLLIAGIVVGFIPWASFVRRLILLLICLGALGTVGVQIAIGFPVEQEIKQEMKGEQGFGAGMGAFGLGNNPGRGGQPNIKIEDIIRVKWQIPLYLTLGLLGTASATSLLGPFGGDGGRRRSKNRKRKRPRDEYDDEDEESDRDDEDERPRKKRRVADEDEDEDDRPRKKKRRDDEDEDEDDRPKKKKRVVADEEDEDEEDRPRKKKVVAAEVEEDEDEPPPPPRTAPKVVVKPSPAPPPPPKPAAQAPKPSGASPNPASKPAAPAPKPATGGSSPGAPAPRRPFGQRPAAPPPPAFEVVEDDEDDPPPKKRKD